MIYDSEDDEEAPESTPQVIGEINRFLTKTAPEDREEDFTVEGIATKIGISRATLYGWVKNDQEFSEALEKLKNIQENDPFKTGTVEDSQVGAMTLTMLLLDARNRRYKSKNQ